MDSKRRNWLFTAFDTDVKNIHETIKSQSTNWTSSMEKGKKVFTALPSRSGDIRFCIYQLERSPTSNRLHLQGYVEFRKSVRVRQCQRIIGASQRLHVETRRGTRQGAIEYCSKDESRVPIGERGTPIEPGVYILGDKQKSQGKRSDLDAIAAEIKSGTSIKDIADEHTSSFIKYHKGIMVTHSLLKTSTAYRGKTDVTVYWGKSGTGKTRKAMYENPDAFILNNFDKKKVWWDGYNGEETIIIDDFYGNMPYDYFLRLTDPYSALVQLEVKGATVTRMFKKIIITSNIPPRDWYPIAWTDRGNGALQRRLEIEGTTIHFEKEWKPDDSEEIPITTSDITCAQETSNFDLSDNLPPLDISDLYCDEDVFTL